MTESEQIELLKAEVKMNQYKHVRAYELMGMVQRHKINAHEAASRMHDIGIYGGDLEKLVKREQQYDVDLVENPGKVRVPVAGRIAPEDFSACGA